MKKNKYTDKLLYFSVFLLFLTSSYAWIGWNGRNVYIDAFADISILFCLIKKKMLFNFSSRNIVSIFVLILADLYFIEGLHFWILTSVIIPLSAIILLDDIEREKCFRFIFKAFAVIMFFSMITYFLVKFFDIPSVGTVILFDDDTVAEGYKVRQNFIFCVDDMGINRFCGPFVEPGHLGTLCALMLLADGLDLTKSGTWIILLSLVLSLSLAGYVLGFFAYLFARYLHSKLNFQTIFAFSLIILLVTVMAQIYNGGDNVLNEKILSRLASNEEEGIIGTHATGDFNYYFGLLFSIWNLLLFGYGEELVDWIQRTSYSTGTGFVFFIVKYGLVGFIISIAFYFTYAWKSSNRRIAKIFLLFMLLCIYQRSYAFSAAWIICFVYGMTLAERKALLKHDINCVFDK